MSQIRRVLKNKNRIDKENRKRRNKEIRDMREEAMYRNRLNEDMKLIKLILEDEEVSHVQVYLGTEKILYMFLKFMYLEELADYSVNQADNNHYTIGRKIINL